MSPNKVIPGGKGICNIGGLFESRAITWRYASIADSLDPKPSRAPNSVWDSLL